MLFAPRPPWRRGFRIIYLVSDKARSSKTVDGKARQRGPARRHRLTPKQRAVVKAFIKNPDLTLRQAGAAAGYGEHSHSEKARMKAQQMGADHALRSPNTRAAFLAAFSANPGLTNTRLAQKIAEGLDATVVKPFAHEGVVIDEKTYIDYPTRAAYLNLAAKLGGLEPMKEVGVGGIGGGPVEVNVRNAEIKDAVAKLGLTKAEVFAWLVASDEAPLPPVEAPPSGASSEGDPAGEQETKADDAAP